MIRRILHICSEDQRVWVDKTKMLWEYTHRRKKDDRSNNLQQKFNKKKGRNQVRVISLLHSPVFFLKKCKAMFVAFSNSTKGFTTHLLLKLLNIGMCDYRITKHFVIGQSETFKIKHSILWNYKIWNICRM